MIPMLLPPVLVELATAGIAFTTSDIVIIIGAVALAVVQIITALKTNKAVAVVKEDLRAQIAGEGEKTTAAIAVVAASADVIAGHVNSAATAQSKTIDGLRTEVALLREMLDEKTNVAAVLAQSVANGKAAGPRP